MSFSFEEVFGFVYQVKRLNELVLDTVKSILCKSRDAIIIIQSDHGSNFFEKSVMINKSLEKDCFLFYLKEHLSRQKNLLHSTDLYSFCRLFLLPWKRPTANPPEEIAYAP